MRAMKISFHCSPLLLVHRGMNEETPQLQSLMSPKIIATKQPGCGDAPSVLTHSSRSLQSQDLASMCWEAGLFSLKRFLPLQQSSSSVIIPTMKFIKITASLLISKFFPNFLLGVLGA